MRDVDALLIFNYLRVGPITARRLLDAFGSPTKILGAQARDLQIAGHLSGDIARRMLDWEKHVNLEAIWETLEREHIKVVTYQDPHYPPLLKEIYDHPLLFYLRGELTTQDAQALSIVGTRTPSPYGATTARKWSAQLAARGFTIVSGLARGIDTQAHIGALEAKGRTIAILGYGFGYVYPKENQRLHDAICERCAVITESAYKKFQGKSAFPLRNRLVAGISRATLVIESRERGGSLITAHFANEYNRSVYAVPGPIHATTSRGTNRLIRDGATLVRSVDEICDDFEFLFPPEQLAAARAEMPKPTLDEREQVLYDLLDEPLSLDDLARRSDISIEKASTTMMTLELKGLVRCLPGKIYDRR
jgi:DNA processing protein